MPRSTVIVGLTSVAALASGCAPTASRPPSLQYDQRVTEGRTQVQPLISPFKVTTECPLSHLLSSRVFEPSGRPWRYAFVAVAHNWKGDSTKSGILRVVTR
jgi:hypothetical protein